jgi:hypothetical protein
MKTRNGFVSNSSSSSFVIGLSRKPKSAEKLAEVLYHDGQGVCAPYDAEIVSPQDAADQIWQQIKDQRPMTKKQLADKISSGWFDGHPEFPFNGRQKDIAQEYRQITGKFILDDDTPLEWRERYRQVEREVWDEYNKDKAAAAAELAERLLSGPFSGKKLYNCSFGDDDGAGTMEHGNTFRSVPHTRISHH